MWKGVRDTQLCVCACSLLLSFALRKQFVAYICALEFAYICWANTAKNYRLLVSICMHYNLNGFSRLFIFFNSFKCRRSHRRRCYCCRHRRHPYAFASKNGAKREIEFYYDIMIIIIISTDYILLWPPIPNHHFKPNRNCVFRTVHLLSYTHSLREKYKNIMHKNANAHAH